MPSVENCSPFRLTEDLGRIMATKGQRYTKPESHLRDFLATNLHLVERYAACAKGISPPESARGKGVHRHPRTTFLGTGL